MILHHKLLNNDTILITLDTFFKEIEYIIIRDNVFDKIKCKFSKNKNQIYFDINKENYIKLLILKIDDEELNTVYSIKDNHIQNNKYIQNDQDKDNDSKHKHKHFLQLDNRDNIRVIINKK